MGPTWPPYGHHIFFHIYTIIIWIPYHINMKSKYDHFFSMIIWVSYLIWIPYLYGKKWSYMDSIYEKIWYMEMGTNSYLSYLPNYGHIYLFFTTFFWIFDKKKKIFSIHFLLILITFIMIFLFSKVVIVSYLAEYGVADVGEVSRFIFWLNFLFFWWG